MQITKSSQPFSDFQRFKPNSWYNLSLEVLLIAPVIANAALYWIDSIFSDNLLLLGWS